MAKKYNQYDITIIYKTGNLEQIKRLSKYVRVLKYKGELIKCDKIFFNYNFDIIDNVEANEYIQIIHADYKALGVEPKLHPKITRYIGASKQVCKTFKELTGKNIELVYNPIEVEKPKRMLNLISTTRLTREKGKERIIKLSKMLDDAGISYMWLIFTDDVNSIKNPNIIYMKPQLDIVKYIANADYLVQLSDNEGYCYSVVESLAVGTPVIVTDCPVFKEIGVKDRKNGFILDFDLKNVPLEDIYNGILDFKYEPKESCLEQYLNKAKSTYEKEFLEMTDVKCIKTYYDTEIDEQKEIEDKPYKVSKVRARILEEAGVIQII